MMFLGSAFSTRGLGAATQHRESTKCIDFLAGTTTVPISEIGVADTKGPACGRGRWRIEGYQNQRLIYPATPSQRLTWAFAFSSAIE